MISPQEDVELTIKNIFEIIEDAKSFEQLNESEQTGLRMALFNMQERAYNKGWHDCINFVQSV